MESAWRAPVTCGDPYNLGVIYIEKHRSNKIVCAFFLCYTNVLFVELAALVILNRYRQKRMSCGSEFSLIIILITIIPRSELSLHMNDLSLKALLYIRVMLSSFINLLCKWYFNLWYWNFRKTKFVNYHSARSPRHYRVFHSQCLSHIKWFGVGLINPLTCHL